MIATTRFVYIHQPKTGGTFVTKVLNELATELETRELRVRTPRTAFVRAKLKHGTCRDIPRALRKLPVWTTIRNPYDQYVSEYAFGWWRREEYPRYLRRRVRDFEKRYPDYPDLSFADFLHLYHEAFGKTRRSRRFESEDGVGWLTERFLYYYARRPRALAQSLRPDIELAAFQSHLYDVHYLPMEDLNTQLHSALLNVGLSEERTAFVLKSGRVLPHNAVAKVRERDWQYYYTPELKAHVRRNDGLLFQMFPAFDA